MPSGTPPRTKRRGLSSRHYPVQGGLRRHSALLPRPGSVPCRNRRPRRIPGDSPGHGEAGGATLASDHRFGPGTVQTSADGDIVALTVPIRGDVVSGADVAAVRQLRGDLILSIIRRLRRPRLYRGQDRGDGRLLHCHLGSDPLRVALRARTELHPAVTGFPVPDRRPRLDTAQPPVDWGGVRLVDVGLHQRSGRVVSSISER